MSLNPLLAEGWVITTHALMALAALLLGLWQLLGPKGTLPHKTVGYTWAALMLGVAGTSFWIHDLRMIGPFSPIHILSIVVLVNVPIAVHAARRGNVQKHRIYMRSLFLFALVAAGAFTLLPGRVMHDVLFVGQ